MQDLSVGLTPQMDVPVPAGLRRADGTSQYVVAGSERFTSTGIIHAEDALIRAATVCPVIPVATQERFEESLQHFTQTQGWTPAPAQVAMARAFATSEQLLAVGIGPAGAGKTTSTSLFVRTAEATGAQVIGLAPTAAAAAVMGQEMDIQADTVDSFLTTHNSGEKKLSPGSVLLVDEMGMLTTPKLARLVEIAQDQGAVVRGIGDHRQLAAIGSGGALRLLEREAGAVHLEEVHRFRHADGTVNEAEAAASLALREPPPSGIEDAPFQWYLDQGRVQAGSEEKMLGEIFARWSADTDAGRSALMAAPTNAQVAQLNELAQAKCMRDGLLDPGKVFTTNTGASIHPGDVILTRDNNRRLRLNQGKDFVKNGDAWTVHEILDDGRLKIQHRSHGGVTTLPAAYASENVELGYASTVNRAQGVTVDRAYTLLDASVTRENAYVGTSRGRFDNQLFVATTPEAGRDDVLATIAANYEQNLSIHETVAREREAHRAITPRVEIYQDLSLLAQEQIVGKAAQNALGVEKAAVLINSDGYGAFAHEVGQLMRDHQVDPEALISRAWTMRDFGDAEDIGAVMHWRVGVVMDNDAAQSQRTPESKRPFSAVSDEHLDALITKAKQRAEAQDAAVEHAAGNLEDPGWFKREFGLVPDKLLTARRKGLAEKMRDNDDPEYRWLMAEMDAEVSRRRWSSPEQRLVEQVARGERPRAGTDLALARTLEQEQKIRTRLIPRAPMPEARPEQLTHGVSGWLVDPTWAEHHLVPKSTADVLKTHHERIGQLAELRGRQLAAEKPAWTEALGEVPINPTNARRWYRVAAEVEAYRAKYKVSEHETQPVPKDHYKRTPGLSPKGQHAAYLAGQVVDVHKRGALSNRPARSVPENQLTAQTAEHKTRGEEQQTPAEQLIAQLEAGPQARANLPERIQKVEQAWDHVVAAWEREQRSQQQKNAAESDHQAAQTRLEGAKKQRESYELQVGAKMRDDIRPIFDARKELDQAGILGRRSKQKELDRLMDGFENRWGTRQIPHTLPLEVLRNDPSWVQLHQAQQDAAAEASAAGSNYSRAEADHARAVSARESAYAAYERARDQAPETELTGQYAKTPSESQRQAQRNRDMEALSKGMRPTAAAVRAQEQRRRTIQAISQKTGTSQNQIDLHKARQVKLRQQQEAAARQNKPRRL